MLPRRASGCVGCRRRENILIRITGLLGSKFRAVIQPAWKALKSNRHKAISRNRLKKVFSRRKSLIGRLSLERVLGSLRSLSNVTCFNNAQWAEAVHKPRHAQGNQRVGGVEHQYDQGCE